jgi:hypothetical protein
VNSPQSYAPGRAALDQLERLFGRKPTDIAKQEMTRAAKACITGDPHAVAIAESALQLLDAGKGARNEHRQAGETDPQANRTHARSTME